MSQPYAPGGTVYWTTYAYDSLGRTLSVTPPGNSGATTYVYEGNLVTVTDPAGKWKTYTTDALGNLAQVTEPDPTLGNVQTYYTYNLRNQLIEVSMPRGATTQTRTFNHDLTTGRLTSTTNPENGTVSYTYNADGTPASKTDAKNQQVQYNALDNLTSVTLTDSANYGSTKTQTRTFVYSTLGRLVSARNPESVTTTYTYYANGALHTKTDARGVAITYTVDGLSRVKKKDYGTTTPVTPAARHCYDGNRYEMSSDLCVADSGRGADYAQGALTHTVARNGSTIVSETLYTAIDAQGRVTSSVQKTPGLPDMAFVYQYGTTGPLAAVQYPSGRWVSYDINGANRVKAVRNGQTGTNYYLQQATYKPDGSFAGATVGLQTGNQWTESHEYNSRLQPCHMQIQKGTQTPLLALQWKHSTSDPDGACEGTGTDNNGNVLAERLQYPSGGSQQTILRSYGYL